MKQFSLKITKNSLVSFSLFTLLLFLSASVLVRKWKYPGKYIWRKNRGNCVLLWRGLLLNLKFISFFKIKLTLVSCSNDTRSHWTHKIYSKVYCESDKLYSSEWSFKCFDAYIYIILMNSFFYIVFPHLFLFRYIFSNCKQSNFR